jgi:tetratricopeptide (TPR) repeat protein
MKVAGRLLRELRGLAKMPMDGMCHLRIRVALLRGKNEEALVMTEQLSEAARERPEYYLVLGGVLANAKNDAAACDAFRRALEIDPDCRAAWQALARALVRQKDWAGVESAARHATGLFFDNPQAHYLIGVACVFQNRPEDACVALSHAVRLAPGFVRAFRLLARVTRRHHPDPLFHAVFRSRAERLTHMARERKGKVERAGDFDRAAFVSFPEPKGAENPSEVITLVTGLPRSGTSLMMQMLTAGGLQALVDDARRPDESNPRGYLEYQPVMAIARDASWMPQARGKVLKVVAPLLMFLPDCDAEGKAFVYRVVFMNRDWREIHASQTRMIERRGETGATRSVTGLKHAFEQQLQRVRSRLVSKGVDAVDVDYADAVAEPAKVAAALANFLPGFDANAAAACVDPALHRERAT